MKENTEKLFNTILGSFQDILKEAEIEKGTLLHHSGYICRNLYLVQSGLLRVYYYSDGKETTAHFASRGGAITAPDSFIKGEKSKYYIESVENSIVFIVDRIDLENYLLKKPHLERTARVFTEAIYLDLLQRIEDIIFLKANDRYHNFAKNNPEVLKLANLGHISSYLGISQETLSRIRGIKK